MLRANEDSWTRMLEAEDTRGAGPAGITPLLDGLTHDEPVIRRIAVRGLGRLERDSLVERIAPLLADGSPAVRAEAANALAQAAGVRGAPAARAALRARIARESDPVAIGAMAESLGRLPHDDSTDVQRTAVLLAGLVDRPSTPDAVRLGTVRGFYFLVRQPVSRAVVVGSGASALRGLSTLDTTTAGPDPLIASRIRRVAAAALVATGNATRRDLATIFRDPDPFVRREAVAGLPGLAGDSAVDLALAALTDSSPLVRYEALRINARLGAGRSCTAVMAAVSDADAHVALLAIERLGTGCGGEGAVALLDSIALTLTAPEAARSAGWHRPAAAAVALARLDPARAEPLIAALERSGSPFVRMRAARVATFTSSNRVLHRLASDADANVRSEAVRGLARVEGHIADSVYIAQLREADDSQLLQAAATALAGSTDTSVAGELLDALDRTTARGRETERDARIALIDRIAELGDSSDADRLAQRVDDFDPRVAERAADVVERWTGERPDRPRRALRPALLPALAEIERLDHARVTIEMEDGTRLRARLFALEAPTNSWRFARLARDGYYDGLTFHRVVPNFVIQGGSPRENEFSGDGPFSRDELGRPNWRGTIGLSTRGRDTGDAQIYINLIDNIRLDHQYTVFGEVTSDLGALGGILEGAVIRRITVD